MPLLNSVHSLLLPAGYVPPAAAGQNGTESRRSSGVMGGLFGEPLNAAFEELLREHLPKLTRLMMDLLFGFEFC